MMGLGPRCFIPSFVEIGPLVPEKKNKKDLIARCVYIAKRSPFREKDCLKYEKEFCFQTKYVFRVFTMIYG